MSEDIMYSGKNLKCLKFCPLLQFLYKNQYVNSRVNYHCAVVFAKKKMRLVDKYLRII